MELLDTITVTHQGNQRSVTLSAGDLAHLPADEAVDLLVVSAFPDDYAATETSLIGSLERAGVSVASLATDKEVDLRRFSSCWLLREIETPAVNFWHVLCFEPQRRGHAHEVVGDIFRSIMPFTAGTSGVSSIAIPIVASGDQGESPTVMLEALADAAVNWLSIGMPLDCIKIVCHDSADSQVLQESFSRIKSRYAEVESASWTNPFRYDLFVSYCQKDKAAVDDLLEELRTARPSLRIFMDRLELRPGAAWQQHIFEALDESRKIVCALSPAYLESPICKEEFNIALLRHRESAEGVLLPVYAFTAQLPSYMKLIHYEDVREGDRRKMSASARNLLSQL